MRYRVVMWELLDSLAVTVTEFMAPEYVEVKAKWHFTISVDDVHTERITEVMSMLAMLMVESLG